MKKQAVLLGVIVVAAAGGGLIGTLPTTTIAIFARAWTRGCSVPAALQAIRNPSSQDALARALESRSLLLPSHDAAFLHWDTPLGKYLVPAGTDLFFVLAEQERDLYGGPKDGVRPGDVVLDAGANVGVFVREALSRGAQKVVAFEPVPRNVAALRVTFASQIAAGRVLVLPMGVWNEPAVLRVFTYQNSALDSFVLP